MIQLINNHNFVLKLIPRYTLILPLLENRKNKVIN